MTKPLGSVPLALMVSLSLVSFARGNPAGTETLALLQNAQQLHSEGKLPEARRLYEQVIPKLRSEGDRKHLGGALYLISLAYSELGEYSKALQAGRESVEIRKTLGDKAGEADSANSVGLALLNLGEYPKALDKFEHSLELYRAVSDFEEQVTLLNNIGNVLLYQGKYLDALDRYLKAKELVGQTAKEEWNAHERQVTTANLAVLYQKLGRNDLALDLYAGLRTTPGVLTPAENGQVLANLGTLYRHLGDPVKALETYRSAQKSFEFQRNYDGEMGVLKNIGIVHALDLGNLPEALRAFREVLRLAQQTSNQREAVQAHLYAGEVYRRTSLNAEADRELGEALSGAKQLGTVEEQWKALYGLGRIAKDERRDADALPLFRQAISLIESVRSRIRLSTLKAEFLADKRDVYDAAIEVLLSPSGPARDSMPRSALDEIHRMMERGRARNFKDQLFDSLESLRARANPALAGRLRELRSQMALNRSHQLAADGEAIKRLQVEFAALEEQYVDIERRLATSAENRAAGHELSVAEIQSRLPADTALVETWTGKETFAAIWISPTEAGISQRRFSEAERREAAGCIERLSSPSTADWKQACAPVGNLILSDIWRHLGAEVRNLIFVPDEKLAALPIEALDIPGTDTPVVERYGICYLPSSSMLSSGGSSVPLSQRMPWTPTLLAFGAPTSAQSGVGLGSSVNLEEEQTPPAYSRYEVESIAGELRGHKGLLLGRDAMKKFLFQADSRRFRLIHLSTHATADLENPQGSRILFAPERQGASSDYLFLGEILGLNLSGSDLVTLSACDTGKGKTIVGEGSQDFSRAFLMSGARSVVATLWRVADQPTAEFMKQFYFYLAQGQPKSQALRKAKLRFLHEQGPLSHPCYWAPFILSGDGFSAIAWPASWGAFLSICLAIALACTVLVLRILNLRHNDADFTGSPPPGQS